MKPAELKLKVSETLSFMRKTMSLNHFTKDRDLWPAIVERMGSEPKAGEMLKALMDLGLLQQRNMDAEGPSGKTTNIVYYRLSETFFKATPNILMRQMGVLKGVGPKPNRIERVALVPDNSNVAEIEYVVRLGDFHYSEPVKGLNNARAKAEEVMAFHRQSEALIFRLDRTIEIVES